MTADAATSNVAGILLMSCNGGSGNLKIATPMAVLTPSFGRCDFATIGLSGARCCMAWVSSGGCRSGSVSAEQSL